jgi:hypothetical protein
MLTNKGPKIFSDDVIAKIREGSFAEFYTWLDTGNWLIDTVKSYILSGQSPVSKVKRRFQKYSKSYLDFLEGKVRFYTIRGKVRPFLSYTTTKKGKVKKSKFSKPFPNKKKSPVNLYATGEMMDSMYIRKDTRNQVAWLGFKDKKAIYHNDLGAGKSRVIRRLLPTNAGEKFIPNIDKTLKDLVKLSLYKTLEKNKTYMKIQFVLTGKR